MSAAVETVRSFVEVFQRLYKEMHTGPVIVHLQHGQPREVELPAPPTRIVLDNGTRKAR